MNIEGSMALSEEDLEAVSGGKMISTKVSQGYIGMGSTKERGIGSVSKDKDAKTIAKNVNSLDGVKVC